MWINLNTYYYWKKLVWKDYILCDSNYMTFWKIENCRDHEKTSGYQILERRKWWIDRTEKNFRALKTIPYDTTVVGRYKSFFIGLGRYTGEGIGYPLQYSWASLVAQLVKNLPAIWETWVRSLGWEEPLEKGKATHSSILAWRIPWTI